MVFFLAAIHIHFGIEFILGFHWIYDCSPPRVTCLRWVAIHLLVLCLFVQQYIRRILAAIILEERQKIQGISVLKNNLPKIGCPKFNWGSSPIHNSTEKPCGQSWTFYQPLSNLLPLEWHSRATFPSLSVPGNVASIFNRLGHIGVNPNTSRRHQAGR